MCTLGAEAAYGRTQIEKAGQCVGLSDWEQFDHPPPPPYSPDLAPSDFHLFLILKSFLDGRRFHDDNEVKETVTTRFASQAASFYDEEIQKPVPPL